MTFDNEIDKIKSEIKVLQSKLEFLESIDDHKEQKIIEAYKKTFGTYPGASASDIQSWNIFQYGYKFGCGELPVEEIENHKDTEPYCPDEPEYYDEIEHDISENIQNNTIRDVIDRWWMDTFTSKNMSSVNECIDDLCDRIEFWSMRNKNT